MTANVYRPGSVDTAMRALIRIEGEGKVSAATHARFIRNLADKAPITPDHSAGALVERMAGETAGEAWDVADSL
ncbi:hypothetical protein [Streptomyces sp. NBC_01497]|uniref:hypothetical protein n=1 Tax=Streptomyces sp. NBC_01497 TaxID=2903885 RepID=UPI002E312D88|nr:hypothetical protein [Streptomyces sp. NBC_01497]